MKQILLLIAAMLLMIPAAYAPVWYGTGDDTGLIGHWKCEGNFLDSSGQGNNGTQSGGVTITTGIKGRGCGFDGSNDWVNATNSGQGLNISKNYTISAWIKIPELPDNSPDVNTIYSYGNNLFFIMNSTGTRLAVQAVGGGYPTIKSSAEPFALNTWYHVVATHNGTPAGSTRLYINGVQNDDGTATTDWATSAYAFNSIIGGQISSSRWWTGSIDEVRIYNRSLSASEISSLYNTTKTYHVRVKTTPVLGGMNETPAPETVDSSGLVGHWKMNDLTNGNTTDSSGQGNNGSVIGPALNASGRWNSGYDFDGNNDYINVADANSIDGGTAVTLSAWIKPQALPGGVQSVAVKGLDAVIWDYGLIIIGDEVGYREDGGDIRTNADVLKTNIWTHIAVVANENTQLIDMYVNGVKYPNSTWIVNGGSHSADFIKASVQPLQIGNAKGRTEYFNGSIDEVRIYNRSLSASEVQELYLSKGLVGYWKMDADQKNSTSTFDSSGYYNHGLISGATLTNEGRFKEGYKFDGVNDYIAKSYSAGLNISGNITVSAWVKPVSVSGRYTVLDDNNAGLGIEIGNVGGGTTPGSFGAITPGLNIKARTGNVLSNNTWQHIVFVKRDMGATNELWLNGVNQSLAVNLDYNLSFSGALTIGARAGGASQFFNGTIDEVRIYNRALTPSEIAGLYNGTKTNHITIKTTPTLGGLNDTPAPAASNETGLVGYWKMDDLTNGNTTDSSEQGHNGSVLSTTTFTNDGRWNSAFAFSGSPNAINTGLTTNFSSFSVSAWFYPNATLDTERPIVSKYVGSFANGSWTLQGNPTNTILWDISDGAQRTCSVSNVELNKWHHVVATSNGTTGILYYDGGASTCTFSVNPISGIDSQIRIGISNVNSWIGKIDEVRIYNRSLSASEVMDLYLNKGLVGYWKMDADQKNSTYTFDSSKYYNHGLITGPTLTNEGRFKEGYKFDGSNDYVNISYSQSLNVSRNPTQYTIGAWIRFAGKEGYDGIVSPRAVAVDSFGMTRETGRNDINCFTYNSTATAFNTFTTTTFADNVWYYVVCTNNGSVVKAYTNGAYEASTTFSGGVKTQSTNGWVIGRYYTDTNDYYFNGTIDEVRIYNRALTASEVAGLYNGTQTYHWRIKTVPG